MKVKWKKLSESRVNLSDYIGIYRQLTGYMESRGCKEGYLINFCFLEKKKYRAEWIEWNGYKIFEIIV